MGKTRIRAGRRGRSGASRPPARRRAAALSALIAALASFPVLGGDNLLEFRVDDRNFVTGLVVARWDARILPERQIQVLPVVWRIHSGGVVNNCNNGNTDPLCNNGSTTTLSVDQAADLIKEAFQRWNDVSASGVPPEGLLAVFDAGCRPTGRDPEPQCVDGKTPTFTVGVDGENIFTWADPTAAQSGAVAITVSTALQQDRVVGPGTRDINGDRQDDLSPILYPDGITLPAGTIIDADISFNASALDWVAAPSTTGTLADILGVALHEQGHWFGFAHSPLVGPMSTMFPFVDFFSLEAQNDLRTLEVDDKASARRFYPEEPAFSSGFGAISGRLVTSAGEPVVGEPVVAIDAVTLDAVAVEFTAHALTENAGGAGSFAGAGSFSIEGLPPGEYFVQVGTLDGTFLHLDRNRYNLETIFGAAEGQRPAFAVEAGQESAADDLLPARRLRVPAVSAGGRVDAGSIVANTDVPSLVPLGTATPLRFGDNQAVLIDFPSGFTFLFYGIDYRRMFVYDNGYVTFTNATSPSPDPIVIRIVGTQFADESLTEFLTHSPRVGALFRNHDPSVDNRGPNTGIIDVYLSSQSDRVNLTWAAVPEVVLSTNLTDRPARADTFTLTLFGGTAPPETSGVIEMKYGSLGTPYATVGITPGGSGVVHRMVDLSRAAAVQAAPLEAVVQEFWAGRLDFQIGRFRFFRGLDLSGGLVRFVPGTDFAYTVTRPDLRPPEVSPPGAAVPLTAAGADPTLLSWEAAAPLFNLYRGLLSALLGSGDYTPPGSCLASALTEPRFQDAGQPPSGDAFYYLVSGENTAGQEGTLGFNSAGRERLLTSPCP